MSYLINLNLYVYFIHPSTPNPPIPNEIPIKLIEIATPRLVPMPMEDELKMN